MYGSALVRSDLYSQLTPCIGIFLLGYDELPSSRFHSTFRLLEVHDHELLSHHLEIHLVELLKLRRACADEWAEESDLVDWARFFRPADAQERENLAMKDPTFAKAKELLENLSDDPEVQYWVRARQEGEVLYKLEIAENRKEAREEGLQQGEASGRAALLLEMLADRFGELPADTQSRVRSAGPDEIRAWSRKLLNATRLEDVFL